MNFKSNLSALLILSLTLITLDVLGQAAPMKWGKLSDEEIKYATCSFEKEASAVILCEYGRVEFRSGSIVSTKHIRIKILDKNGFSHSNISRPYYTKDGLEKITKVKAQTLNVDEKGNLKKYKIERSEFYDVDNENHWRELKFSFPAIKEGSIVEYEYTTVSKNVISLEGWSFQDGIPTLHSELRAIIPKGLDYQVLMQGPRLMKKSNETPASRWILKNLPALKEEPYNNNRYDYAEKIRFQLAGYTKYSNTPGISGPEYINLMTTWEALSAELLKNYAFSRYLNRDNKAKDIVNRLTTGITNDLEKARLIYNFVNHEITWNHKFRIFSDQSISSLLSEKEGNSAEINLFLTLLLREAGLDANPVLVSTVDHGKIIKTYPLLSQFNHIICNINLNGKNHQLDATDPYIPYDLLPSYDLNNLGYLLEENNPQWINIIPSSKTSVFSYAVVDLNKAIPEMQLNMKYKGYMAEHIRKKLKIEEEQDFIYEDFVQNIEQLSMADMSIQNEKFTDKPLEVDCSFHWQNNAQFKKDIIYFKPFLNNGIEDNPFKSEKRQLPVDFTFPFNYSFVISIKLQEGYMVEELPEGKLLKLPNEYGSFTYQAKLLNGSLQMVSSFSITTPHIPVIYYPALREFYKLVIAQYNEPVVLKKI